MSVEYYAPGLTGVAVLGAASAMLLGWKFWSTNRRTLEGDLTGKTVIVTGANTGIGFWTAQALAARHAKVILACRSLERGREACQKIVTATGNDNVHVRQLDLFDFSSVRQFAEEILQNEERLDILVNNAGMFAQNVQEPPSEHSLDLTLTVNHLGPYLLTRLLIGLLRRSAPSRIINVSSGAQRFIKDKSDFDALEGKKSLKPFQLYCLSKLANILFTRELTERLAGTGITSYSLHPGVVATEIWRNLSTWQAVFVRVFFFFNMKSSEDGAETSIYLCLAKEEELKPGQFYVDCAPAENKLTPLVHDKDLAHWLWEVSAQLTGIPADTAA